MKEPRGTIRELVGVIVPALLIAVVIQTFLIKPFRIPSESMMPTLLVGDYLFVSKFAYGYSRFSLPFSPPVFTGRVFASAPKRGDVVVFRLPIHDSEDYIKRVIGLPGDDIQVIGGILHINGKAVPRQRLDGDFTFKQDGMTLRAQRWQETLPNGVSYVTLDLQPDGPGDNTEVYHVPPGHYFMMGDNRDDSADSRLQSVVGYVPFENFVGPAEFIFLSVDGGAGAWEFWGWPWTVRASRLFSPIR